MIVFIKNINKIYLYTYIYKHLTFLQFKLEQYTYLLNEIIHLYKKYYMDST